MIKGIEHIAIFSNDTDRLKNWYIDMFGFKQVYNNGKGTCFVQSQDGCMIEFCMTDKTAENSSTNDYGIRHLAISSDNIEEDAKRMIDNNVEVVTPLTINEKNGVGTFFFRDIDGNILHFISRVTPLA